MHADDNVETHRSRSVRRMEENRSSRDVVPPLFPDYPGIFEAINLFPDL